MHCKNIILCEASMIEPEHFGIMTLFKSSWSCNVLKWKWITYSILFYVLILFTGEIPTLGSFEGHSEDHLTFLGQSKSNIFIGARDGLYNLSRVDLSQQSVRYIISLNEHYKYLLAKKNIALITFLTMPHRYLTGPYPLTIKKFVRSKVRRNQNVTTLSEFSSDP